MISSLRDMGSSRYVFFVFDIGYVVMYMFLCQETHGIFCVIFHMLGLMVVRPSLCMLLRRMSERLRVG